MRTVASANEVRLSTMGIAFLLQTTRKQDKIQEDNCKQALENKQSHNP